MSFTLCEKNQLKWTKFAIVTAVKSFDDARTARVLTLNGGFTFDSQIQILGGPKILKYINNSE